MPGGPGSSSRTNPPRDNRDPGVLAQILHNLGIDPFKDDEDEH